VRGRTECVEIEEWWDGGQWRRGAVALHIPANPHAALDSSEAHRPATSRGRPAAPTILPLQTEVPSADPRHTLASSPCRPPPLRTSHQLARVHLLRQSYRAASGRHGPPAAHRGPVGRWLSFSLKQATERAWRAGPIRPCMELATWACTSSTRRAATARCRPLQGNGASCRGRIRVDRPQSRVDRPQSVDRLQGPSDGSLRSRSCQPPARRRTYY
jgi:hypothetical protein